LPRICYTSFVLSPSILVTNIQKKTIVLRKGRKRQNENSKMLEKEQRGKGNVAINELKVTKSEEDMQREKETERKGEF